MNIRNPYEYNPYALDGEARPRGVRGLFDRAFGMVGCLAASAALFFGRCTCSEKQRANRAARRRLY